MKRLLDFIEDHPAVSFILFMALWVVAFLFLPMFAVAWWRP